MDCTYTKIQALQLANGTESLVVELKLGQYIVVSEATALAYKAEGKAIIAN